MEKTELIKTALGELKPDIVLKNAYVVNVYSGDITVNDVAIKDDVIAGVGDYDGECNIDVSGKYVLPGFINAHCHVESSMVTPYDYCNAELRWGTTTIITDPHEIVNVAGHDGIKYVLDQADIAPVNYYVQMPSCVPATSFEHSGAIMNAEDLAVYKDNKHVLGLGEMMNYVGVNCCDREVLDKIDMFSDTVIDGHAPGLSKHALNSYVAAGIHTEHECTTYEEALEKLRLGLAILVREGSASKNLEAIITGVVRNNTDTFNMAFATDDKHIYDIYKEGTIRHSIVKSVALGLDPVQAVKMATINAARIYGLEKKGAVVPGYMADIVVVDDLKDFNVSMVYKSGNLVCESGKMTGGERKISKKPQDSIMNSVNIKPVSADSLKVEVKDVYPVINMIPGQIVTERLLLKKEEVSRYLEEGKLLKIAVIERHHATGNIGTGYIMGYGLKHGAVATTVAHDSHNLIVVGDNDEDMLKTIEEIVRINGGYAICSEGRLKSLPLRICGLMSEEQPDVFHDNLKEMIYTARKMGVNPSVDPFITLSFMALPVIPSLRLTDMGMFDVDKWRFI